MASARCSLASRSFQEIPSIAHLHLNRPAGAMIGPVGLKLD